MFLQLMFNSSKFQLTIGNKWRHHGICRSYLCISISKQCWQLLLFIHVQWHFKFGHTLQGPKVGDTESYKQISNGAGSNISAIHFGPLHLLKVTKYVLVFRDWAFGYNYRTYLKALLIRRLSNGHQPFGRKK